MPGDVRHMHPMGIRPLKTRITTYLRVTSDAPICPYLRLLGLCH